MCLWTVLLKREAASLGGFGIDASSFPNLDIHARLEYAEISLRLFLGFCNLTGSDRDDLFENSLPR